MGRIISIERCVALRRLDDAMDVSAMLADTAARLRQAQAVIADALARQRRVNAYLEQIHAPNTAA